MAAGGMAAGGMGMGGGMAAGGMGMGGGMAAGGMGGMGGMGGGMGGMGGMGGGMGAGSMSAMPPPMPAAAPGAMVVPLAPEDQWLVGGNPFDLWSAGGGGGGAFVFGAPAAAPTPVARVPTAGGFSAPAAMPLTAGASAALQQLLNMGFERSRAEAALASNRGDVGLAISALLDGR